MYSGFIPKERRGFMTLYNLKIFDHMKSKFWLADAKSAVKILDGREVYTPTEDFLSLNSEFPNSDPSIVEELDPTGNWARLYDLRMFVDDYSKSVVAKIDKFFIKENSAGIPIFYVTFKGAWRPSIVNTKNHDFELLKRILSEGRVNRKSKSYY